MKHQSSTIPLPTEKFLNQYAPVAEVTLCPGLVAHQARDLVGMWEAMEAFFQRECETPFWAIAWPAGSVLARMFLDGDIGVAGLSVLDIGCGGGIVSIAAAKAGARRTVGNDIDPVALFVAQVNAQLNTTEIQTNECDFNECEILPDFDVVTAADMFYERSGKSRIYPLLQRYYRNGARVLVADGQRAFTPRIGLRCIADRDVTVDVAVESVSNRHVRVMEMCGETG